MTDPTNVRYRKRRGGLTRICRKCHAERHRQEWARLSPDARAGRLAQSAEARRRKKGYSKVAPRDRWPRGERHGMARLTVDDVTEIRRLAASGSLQQELADAFGVGQTTISNVMRRRTWAHLA